MIPGGYECCTLTHNSRDRVFIKCRKGFIKYSLEYGYKVYPVYTFNENKLFIVWNYFEKIRLWLNKFKIPTFFFFGNLFFPILPRTDVELITVVGKPIEFPLISKPTKDDVSLYHEKYMNALKELFHKYKKRIGLDENAEIELI